MIKTYMAEAERLIEAPSGATRLATLLETPAFFCRQSSVTGKVAEDELVQKAVIRADPMALK